MVNEQNLKRPTSEEARKNGRKGGKASAEGHIYLKKLIKRERLKWQKNF